MHAALLAGAVLTSVCAAAKGHVCYASVRCIACSGTAKSATLAWETSPSLLPSAKVRAEVLCTCPAGAKIRFLRVVLLGALHFACRTYRVQARCVGALQVHILCTPTS